jgi:sigma-B regulation protein RsbU (phosphoserine phosphatase)
MTDRTITVLISCDSPETGSYYSNLLSQREDQHFISHTTVPDAIAQSLSSLETVDCVMIESERASAIARGMSCSTEYNIPLLIISDRTETLSHTPGKPLVSYIKRNDITGPMLAITLLYAVLKAETSHKKNRQEEELRKLSRAVEQSPATVVITDTGGNIEYVNPKFTNLTGYSFAEALGKNPRILKSGEQPPEFYSDMWKAISAGDTWRGEFHNRKRNGDLYWESASISPILDDNGTVTHYIAVKEDITERKEAQEALFMSEEKLRIRNHQMEKDMKIAQAAQKGLIQTDIPVDPYIAVAYRYNPLEKVGGDFFSFFHRGPGEMGIFLCDVSGHGIAAALFTALIKSAAERTFREHAEHPVRYINTLNRELKDHLSNYFITGIYGFLKVAAGGSATFTFTNGGHPLPILFRNDNSISLMGKSNTVIGILDEPLFEEQVITLSAGERLFLYTDGIPETGNSDREIIDFDENLLTLFTRSQCKTLEETTDRILHEVTTFRGDSPPGDDISLIGVEIR